MMNEKMPFDAAYKMKRYADKLDQKQKDHVKFMSKLLELYGEHDAEGKPVFEYQGEGEERRAVGYKLKDSETFNSKVKAYLDSEFEVEVSPLYATELKTVNVSPSDLTVLEPFIADLGNL
jgi:hypothetical protein